MAPICEALNGKRVGDRVQQLIAAERFKQHGRRTGVLAHLEGLLIDVTGDQNHPGLQTECPHFLAERHAGHLG
jgi:hypothetical protein